MKLYGLMGFTHGWAKTLTVMSPAGRTAALARIAAGPDVEVVAGPDRFTRYHERRAGALAALVARYAIEVLDKPAWDAEKAALGAAIWH